jgi:general secretion pathway protein H
MRVGDRMRMRRRRTRAGLTLVEVLVVLAVVGVVAAMVVLGVRTDGDPARVEANRFADRLRLAADEALIAGRPARGYAFESDARADDDDWGARHDLPREVRFWAPQARLTVDPDGVEAPVVMTMRDRRQGWRITFDGLSAEVAPLGAEAP